MLKLGGKLARIDIVDVSNKPELFRVSAQFLPSILRKDRAYLVDAENIPKGYAHYLIPEKYKSRTEEITNLSACTVLPPEYFYLGHNDVIRLSADRANIRVLFRANSSHNSFLMTEQCNHYCLMCSQPPKSADDSWLLDEIETLLPLIPQNTIEIGFTGGEPTLNKERFIRIMGLAKSYLPRTAVHVLSNGRSFADLNFAKKYAAIQHPDIMVGIPIYSDDPALHDYIVQAQGALDETLRGILNLKMLGQKVEIRVVLHKQSITRLKELCVFISRNLLFVDHVALMGLEMMGFTRANIDALWIDPADYKDTLSEAVAILNSYKINVSIYNHQLCLVNDDVYPFYRKSISDWKNEYTTECTSCTKKNECGGFFSSGVKFGYSRKLVPFT